jgi:phospholipid/cholesterol/gamma-HCH transport system substrate-binding protein
MNDSRGDIKQTLHVVPTVFQNFMNIYQPAQSAVTGILAPVNFADTVQFLCGAIESAARVGAKQSAKLCEQYLSPIIKNRQYNFPPIGINPFVGASARPNELTYSEDRLNPHLPPPPSAPAPPPQAAPPGAPSTRSVDPSQGLQGLMLPSTPPSGGP